MLGAQKQQRKEEEGKRVLGNRNRHSHIPLPLFSIFPSTLKNYLVFLLE